MTIPLTKDGKPDKRYKPKNNIPKDLTISDLPKIDQFVYYQFQGYETIQAALAAGYAENTAKSILYKLRNSERYQTACQEYAIANNIALLPKVAKIDKNIIDLILKDPENYTKYKDVPRQIKQSTGILQETGTHTQQLNVNILTQVQSYQAGRAEDRLKELRDVTPKDDEE
jgi:phage terminase small subunit